MERTAVNCDSVVGVYLKNGVWTNADESEFGGAVMDPVVDQFCIHGEYGKHLHGGACDPFDLDDFR